MTFELEINGQVRKVAVEPIRQSGAPSGRFRVVVDGLAHEVDAREADGAWSILYLADGRSADVAVAEGRAGAWVAELPAVTVDVQIDGRRFSRGPAGGHAGTGEQRLLAPMPGRIVKLLVQPGDEVVAKQGLVVIEAMKMENELTALRPGRVREIAVTEGASVEAGRLLLVVE